MINKYCSAFDGITNSGYLYGKLDCEFFDCFVHSFSFRKSVSPAGESDMCLRHAICLLCKRDIVLRCKTAICSPVANVEESTLPINPHAAQFAAYRAAGISHANNVKRISQIREDLSRFSLSAFADKLNFPRALSPGTYPRGERNRLRTRAQRRTSRLLRAFSDCRIYTLFFSGRGKRRS